MIEAVILQVVIISGFWFAAGVGVGIVLWDLWLGRPGRGPL